MTEQNNMDQPKFPLRGTGGFKIFLIGFMGCGKTHWGRLLGKKLKLPFYDLDTQIEESEGKPINEIFRGEGEEYFRMVEKDMLHLITETHETLVIACGGGTPCFYNNIDFMKSKGIVVWMNCSIDCLYNRLLKDKEARPLIRNLTDAQLRSYIIKKFSSRRIYYQQATLVVNEEEMTIEKLADNIFHV